MLKVFLPIKIIVILVLAGLLTACERGEETARFPLSEEAMAFIPYQADDSVPFIHSGGFTFNLVTHSRASSWEQSERKHPGDDYYSFQVETVILISFQPDLSITMEINALQDDPYFSLKVNRYEFGKYLFSLPDLDTLEINGKTYHDVYFLADVSVDPSVISPDSVFYTAENGIIQISLSNGEAFHLHN